jgi:hypothetical protein
VLLHRVLLLLLLLLHHLMTVLLMMMEMLLLRLLLHMLRRHLFHQMRRYWQKTDFRQNSCQAWKLLRMYVVLYLTSFMSCCARTSCS